MMVYLFSCVLAAAVLLSMFGQGGGVLYTPAQLWFGIGFHEAATTSLFLIMVTSISATLVYRKEQRIDWPLAIALESATALGGFAGGVLSESFSAASLSFLFSAVLVFAAYTMIRTSLHEGTPRHDSWGYLRWQRRLGNETYAVNMALALPLSLVAGLMSGLLGIGGGLLKVPLMVLILHIPIEIAVGSSALMVGFTAAGGFAGHLIHGHWNWHISLILAAAASVGGQIGSRVSLGLNKRRLHTGSRPECVGLGRVLRGYDN
jgi:hypothetical protein